MAIHKHLKFHPTFFSLGSMRLQW